MVKFKLLTVGNVKTMKGEAQGFLTAVLHLAPGELSGVNLCAMAVEAGCLLGCLNTAGRGGIAAGGMVTHETLTNGTRTNKVQTARLRRAVLFNTDRDAFMRALIADIHEFALQARKLRMKPCIRLNGTSDIRWEDIATPVTTFRKRNVLTTYKPAANIFAAFPRIQFYDYTKLPNRRRALGIANYHLTFSYSHRASFAPHVVRALQTYGNAVNFAVVFAGKAPAHFLGREVISGDSTDLRFLDAPARTVALTAKGNAKKDASGFVVPA